MRPRTRMVRFVECRAGSPDPDELNPHCSGGVRRPRPTNAPARCRHGCYWLAACALAIAVAARAAEVEIPLSLDPASVHDLVLTRPTADIVEIRTTGVDPFVATLPFNPGAGAAQVLSFEYIAIAAVPAIEVFVGRPWTEARSQSAEQLPVAEGWSTFSLDLRAAWERTSSPPDRLRLDFGRAAGHVIQLRNLRLRPPNPRENEADGVRLARQQADRALDGELRAYLGRSFSAHVNRVEVHADEIEISGDTGGAAADLFLAESPVWQQAIRERSLPHVAALPANRREFSIKVPRYLASADGRRDRLFTRWLIVRAGARGEEQLSAARYADAVAARHAWPEKKPRSKKGLGGFTANRPELLGDLDALGIDSVTVNLQLSRYLRAQPSAKTFPFNCNGRTYQADRAEIEKLDRTLLAAARRDALVLGILLVSKAGAWDGALGKIMQHPDCEPAGTFSMANVTSAEGVEHYLALLDFLAERYSRPGAPFGRIHHFIVHNEVDAGWVWTNCGEKPPVLYLDQYHKSMRLAQLVARQYDPHARAYISLTHHWAATANHRFYPGREVLGHLLAFSRVEGDFDWGIALHPYPESLREPKTWRDRQATFSFDTPMITFKNVEVLDAWVREPAQRFRGREIRSVHLSEQGPNSPDYSAPALREQAAALAYVWQKIRRLETIEAFEFHNWIDNRGEGGLRIGLRRFPDDREEPFGRKPVWHVYRALDTADEAEATAFALPIIGVQNWDEVPYRGAIRR